jgi:hypothetical protein
MAKRATSTLIATALAATLALGACSRADDGNLASLDNELIGNDADPALTSALQDQIAVDRSLAQQSNRNAVRPPETPAQAQYPTAGGGQAKGGTAQQQAQLASVARGEGGAACGSNAPFDYNPAWANRLSTNFPLYPGGRITEAAGSNQGDCRVRVVTFTTGDTYQRVLDWYHTRAVRAGYSSEHQLRESDHILAGAKEQDGGAFYLIVTPRRSGSEVALIANNGR